MSKNPVIWLTGMSGSGKTTLANYLKDYLKTKDCEGVVIDGDSVRDLDKKKIGFGVDDVLMNNTRIASLCEDKRRKYDFVLVPVISPYEEVRQKIRKILEPNFHLVYLKTDIDLLKSRDTKGLYAAADRGEIKDLVGYSDVNPYDEPINPELIILMSNDQSVNNSFNIIFDYFKKTIFLE
jgi:adenylylsulfate kinase